MASISFPNQSKPHSVKAFAVEFEGRLLSDLFYACLYIRGEGPSLILAESTTAGSVQLDISRVGEKVEFFVRAYRGNTSLAELGGWATDLRGSVATLRLSPIT